MILENFKIETSRLILRPFAKEDREAMFKLQSNPEMTRFTPDEPWKTLDDADNFIRFAQRLYRDEDLIGGFRYFFAVVEKASTTVIGYCGVGGAEFDRALPEVFYGIDPEYWGMGYATEAAREVLKYSFTELNLEKLVGFAEAKNIASLRVLHNAGLKRVGVIAGLPEEFGYYNGEVLFELTRDEWAVSNQYSLDK